MNRSDESPEEQRKSECKRPVLGRHATSAVIVDGKSRHRGWTAKSNNRAPSIFYRPDANAIPKALPNLLKVPVSSRTRML